MSIAPEPPNFPVVPISAQAYTETLDTFGISSFVSLCESQDERAYQYVLGWYTFLCGEPIRGTPDEFVMGWKDAEGSARMEP